MSHHVTPETAVDAGEAPVRCPYCERPFRVERTLWLHVGERHVAACTADEREAYEAAREDEEDDLFVFHLKVVAALTVLYASFVVLYMVVLAVSG
ncbi:DUF7410 domain-containing protein [Halomarina litorea]|uniref:DUF7410 domain-containing protein n=1 Tax=Halomarina litorea TaxID=2961595 RepID=UPI0020C4EB0D|nr:hypothetical protein [Halomarina sp. BCD28]